MTRSISASLLGALALAGLPLAACAPDRVVTGSTYPTDHHVRHPIVLTQSPESLDLFPTADGLDERQQDDLVAFLAEYRNHGRGPLTASVPAGPISKASGRGALTAVHAVLARTGIPDAQLVVTSYRVADPALAAPIRLSFRRLQAKVASRCGLWPQDLGVSNVRANANNEPYWNLGCAMQSNIAAQAADPLDFVRARAEGRPDTIRRGQNIEKLRKGEDPSTEYRTPTDKINQTIGSTE
jgi:pilus assembly protein CpaD